MSGWACTQLCEFEYDTVLCADARVLMEQYFIDRLRQAGYKDMRMKNQGHSVITGCHKAILVEPADWGECHARIQVDRIEWTNVRKNGCSVWV